MCALIMRLDRARVVRLLGERYFGFGPALRIIPFFLRHDAAAPQVNIFFLTACCPQFTQILQYWSSRRRFPRFALIEVDRSF
jgi:hypothetical protein